jgi:Ca2+-binding EF-hand superfamily protein
VRVCLLLQAAPLQTFLHVTVVQLQMMRTMDVDNDGQIDYMEFVAASMSAYQMSHGLTPATSIAWQKRVRLVFEKIDEDGNGYITAVELMKLMGDSQATHELIKEADRNGDGMIDYQEFQEVLREKSGARALNQMARAKAAA